MFSCALCFFVFFKQKTAYEMRISDWSSDVCSSDLHRRIDPAGGFGRQHDAVEAFDPFADKGAPRRVPAHLVTFAEMRGEGGAQVGFIDRRGAQQQGILGLVAQLAGHKPWFTVQRAVVEQPRHASVRELVALRVLRMLPGNAVRSAERRVGKVCVSTWRSRWATYH